MSAARAVIGAADLALGRVALLAARALNQGLVVLYHRVSLESDPVYPPLAPDAFDAHLELLAAHFDVLPASEWVARLRGGKSLRHCCTITFDDGYRDFLDHALPALQRRRLPATQFLVTECLTEGVEPWTLRARRLDVDGGVDALGSLSGHERALCLRKKESASGATPGATMLRESDISALLRADVEIGSHTMSHAWLTRIEPTELKGELTDSRVALSALCGTDVRLVSYPQGLRDARVQAAAVDAGYHAGFGVDQRAARPGCDPMAVPRFDLTDRPVGMVRLEISGVIPTLRRLRRVS